MSGWKKTVWRKNWWRRAGETGATAVASLIMDYAGDTVQWWLDDGFDVFGLGVNARPGSRRATSFCSGTFAFVRADAFRKLGAFDEEFFMYGEESDLAWRIWISGESVVAAPKGAFASSR